MCNEKNIHIAIKPVAYDGDTELFNEKLQDLPQLIWHFCDLVKICNNFIWPVGLASEDKNERGFYIIVIDHAGLLDGSVNFHGQHVVQVWNLTVADGFHWNHLFCIWNALKTTLWDKAFKFGCVHVVWDGRRIHRLSRAKAVRKGLTFWLCAPALLVLGINLQPSKTCMLALTLFAWERKCV